LPLLFALNFLIEIFLKQNEEKKLKKEKKKAFLK